MIHKLRTNLGFPGITRTFQQEFKTCHDLLLGQQRLPSIYPEQGCLSRRCRRAKHSLGFRVCLKPQVNCWPRARSWCAPVCSWSVRYFTTRTVSSSRLTMSERCPLHQTKSPTRPPRRSLRRARPTLIVLRSAWQPPTQFPLMTGGASARCR